MIDILQVNYIKHSSFDIANSKPQRWWGICNVPKSQLDFPQFLLEVLNFLLQIPNFQFCMFCVL
jgi:hypothetical protein